MWYSKKKLQQDFRCNEYIENIYHGIERVSGYAPLIPEKEAHWGLTPMWSIYRQLKENRQILF